MCSDLEVDTEEPWELDRRLELDLNTVGICHACLSFVSFPLDLGDEAEVRRALRRFAPVLWAEGLAMPLQVALDRARRERVPGAAEAIADVGARGCRAAIVRAVIRRLAADLKRQSRELLRESDFIESEAKIIRLRAPDRQPRTTM